MFKAARWRGEKNKAKVIFKLQFHATQVPQLGSEAMAISLVPADVGRPTARSEKAAAVDGACSWANPVYETVKLVRNQKTGKTDEKVYRFLLFAAGSSKADILGEASINLADYADVFKASSVALPLKGSTTGAILHITIHRMQGDSEGRGGDEDGETVVKRQRRTLQSQLSMCDHEEGVKAPNAMIGINFAASDGSHINNQARVKFPSRRDIPIHITDSIGNLQKSHSFDAISASGSDTSSGIYTPRENGIKNNNIERDPTSFLLSLTNSDTPKKLMFSSSDLSGTSAPDGSADASTSSSGDAGLNETSHDSEDSIEKLRSDIFTLTRKLEVSDLELQTLRKQVIKENKRGQELSRELSIVKEERDALRKSCDELKFSEKMKTFDKSRTISTDPQNDGEDHLSLFEEIKQELDHEKNLNVHLRLQLKMMQQANSELMLAVKDLDGLLDQKNRETPCITCSKMDIRQETDKEVEAVTSGNGLPRLQKAECKPQLLETISRNDNEEQHALDALVNECDDMKIASSLESKIIDLNNEVEYYRKDREDLEMQMEQLALDYEILKQENHDITTKFEQMQLREQLRMQYECSAHLAIISELESHVESLEIELQKQAEAFEVDIATITHAKVEQEKRAILAEEELRKTKWNNSNIVERLQEEFRSLSAHMSSTFQENENIVMQTLKETSELRLQKCNLEELLEKTNKDLVLLQDHYQMKFKQLVGLIDFKSKEANRLLVELKDKKIELENCKISEEARQKNSLEEMQLLRTEMEKLKLEKSLLSVQNEEKEKLLIEMELLRTSIKGSQMSLRDKNLEIDFFQKEISVLKEEENKSLVEMNKLRHMKDKKDATIAVLNSEAETLGQQYSELKHAFHETELEKQKLRKSVSRLKEQMTTSQGKKVDNSCTITTPTNGLVELVDSSIEDLQNDSSTTTENMQRNIQEFDKKNMSRFKGLRPEDDEHFLQTSKCASKDEIKWTRDYIQQSRGDKEHINDTNGTDKEFLIRSSGTDLAEEDQVFISSTNDQKKIADELGEVEVLKKQNELMESELQEMQERYSEISLKFAEVEGERQQLLMTIRSLKNGLKN